MDKLLSILTCEMGRAFEACGYERKKAAVAPSARPDLCEYQCSGAMALAKKLRKAPMEIAGSIAGKLKDSELFTRIQVISPGFINFNISEVFLASYLNEMMKDQHMGCAQSRERKTIVVDYGGPNVAKPLHVGHLRAAIIGESIKRIGRYMGHEMIGDVHIGDWGLQMGLIIAELKYRMPDLVYYDDEYRKKYPEKAPFTIADLESIYTAASARAKADEEFKEEARQATVFLQNRRPGYYALWKHIVNISVQDIRKIYDHLNVHFDLWYGESDAEAYIPDMIDRMRKDGYAYESDGALVVDVSSEDDEKEVVPCILKKSDGASLYTTTDLATIVQREKDFHPDMILYVVDKRQEMHFLQVFRCARKTGLVQANTSLFHLGFGTMNGKDGKPFKTREGGVMRLEVLMKEITGEMYRKMEENSKNRSEDIGEEAILSAARLVAVAALKYGDLSNQASKDYVFDMERFTSFEGKSGPYILYTIVRIKSILNKYEKMGENLEAPMVLAPIDRSEKNLMIILADFGAVIEAAFEELAPHKICTYIYELSNAFNRFYHETKILSQTDEDVKKSHLSLLVLSKRILEACIDVLGFSAPDSM
ncbi:arginine--tRNA ligase [Lachnospiraceae bacterium 54-53]